MTEALSVLLAEHGVVLGEPRQRLFHAVPPDGGVVDRAPSMRLDL